jgi:branched-subunit amino acid aminotransferase/4-amino-4-deoxychorismate lyase
LLGQPPAAGLRGWPSKPAAGAFVTGTMGGLAPVVAVDGRTIGDGGIGPVTKQLTEAYLNLTATTGTEVA